MIRSYINAVESTSIAISEEKQAWIEWARRKADWYDPMIESEDKLLSGIDRDRLQ